MPIKKPLSPLAVQSVKNVLKKKENREELEKLYRAQVIGSEELDVSKRTIANGSMRCMPCGKHIKVFISSPVSLLFSPIISVSI